MLLSKRIYLLLIFVLLFLSSCKKTQPGSEQQGEFIKSFGGAYINEAVDMLQDRDNIFLLSNTTNESGEMSILVIKADAFGNRIWEKRYPANGKPTKGSMIIKTSKDGEFAIVGAVRSDVDSLFYDTYILFIDFNGNVVRDKVFYRAGRSEVGQCIGLLDNGGFTIASESYAPESLEADSCLFFPVSELAEPILLKPTAKTGSKLLGICKRVDNNGFLISAYNDVSQIISISINGTWDGVVKPNIEGVITGVVQDAGGSTYVCGVIQNNVTEDYDGFLAKFDDIDNSINYSWLKTMNIEGYDKLQTVIVGSNNRLLSVGYVENTLLNTYDVNIVETDSLGEIKNIKAIGGNDNEYGVKILSSGDDKYIIEATTGLNNNSMVTIIKTSFQ